MFGITSSTLLRASFALAVFCSWQPGASIGQTVPVSPAATVAKTDGAVEPVCPAVSGTTPPTVNPGQSARLTICTNGTVDLGNLTIGQFGIRPSAFASNYKILNQYATAMLFDVDIASSAKPGRWTVFVNDASGREALALDIFIASTLPPPPPKVCTATTCPDPEDQCCFIAGQHPVCCSRLTEKCGVENGLTTCVKITPP
jgi:hypothetical protein